MSGEGAEDLRGWLSICARIALHGPSGPFDLDVSFQVAKGSFVALAGPSGAGKTTLLRLVAGLAEPDAGRIAAGAEVWCDIMAGSRRPVRTRPIGFVFQDYALFPNMSVRGNLDYALGRHADRREADRLLELVGLEQMRDAYPGRLSGGQKQRLALIRALARRPEVLLLDEPLSALDPMLRRRLQRELKTMHVAFGTTTLMVSHDLAEIAALADRVLHMEDGRVTFDGTPLRFLSGVEPGTVLDVPARHVSGPDANGDVVVLHDGRAHTIRCRNALPDCQPGDLVMLAVTEADIRRAPQD